jgi:hypothetical protein
MEQRRRSTPVGAIRMLRRRVGSARKEKLWALGRAACATRRKRELREASTGDKKLRRESAMVWRRELLGGDACGGEERVRGLDWWGGTAAGALGSAL